MRLLHTNTLQMGEFFASSTIPIFETQRLGSELLNRQVPEYAILSHVWGPEEVSFQDMVGDRSLAIQKTGWEKIRDSCKQARHDGFDYIWIDTCCIDKTSSTELSEAINSMFQWYKDSRICYVYLPDVDKDNVLFSSMINPGRHDIDPKYSVIYNHKDDNATRDRKREILRRHPYQIKLNPFQSNIKGYSRWFSRGWTLQELLAPLKVQFFDKYWRSIGGKEDHLDILSEITNIDRFTLNGGDRRRLSIARRMSWAANRQTTRAEDMAYCLLGIFEINMPLLYGEGARAFVRLQEEILKVSNDQSLFAWRDPTMEHYRDDYPEASHPQGLLAASPDVFEYSNTIAQFYTETSRHDFSSSTNKGLRVKFLMCQDPTAASGLVYLAVLSCQIGNIPGLLPAIRLRRITSTGDQYVRIDMPELLQMCSWDSQNRLDFGGFDPTKPQDQLTEIDSKTVYLDWTVQTVFIRQEPQFPLLPGFWLVRPESWGIEITGAYPTDLWDKQTGVMQPQNDFSHGTKKVGALFVDYGGIKCFLIFGVTYWELTPWCHIIPCTARPNLKKAFEDFCVDQVQLPTNMETRRHEHVSHTLKLRTVTELKSVSGRDMYLIYLVSAFKDLDEILVTVN
ncbi:HET-domain-containing protein [Hyaloscypha variabilis F]|uniref:HET-domain-containing protein n=1 Tax=Hyaloscypha variabilis (strain UAMH 11265 / GT02V1 / F) TaxID=1149755 RepID=A0A2J6RLW0_HYAVF|nr:HET-domain-containing protein [Hyaloscypha variabilis F]